MADLSRETVPQTVMPVLAKAFAGPADPRGTHFVDNELDTQFLELIDSRGEIDEELLAGIVAPGAHPAYHLGAPRQVAQAVAAEGATPA